MTQITVLAGPRVHSLSREARIALRCEGNMTGKLFLYLSEFSGIVASGIAAIWGIGAQQQKQIDTLEDMVKAIGQNGTLDEIVIFAHGIPGGIILDDAGYALDDPVLAKELGKTKTKAKHIRFEGCWVGLSPVEMAIFGRIFDATDVSGFTWVSWTNEINVTIPKGIKAPDLSKFLQKQNLEKWLMPGSTSVQVLASMARTVEARKTLPLLWYQSTLNRKPPYEGNNFAQGGRHSYRSRSEAMKRTVAAAKAVNNEDPVAPFEYVTVTL